MSFIEENLENSDIPEPYEGSEEPRVMNALLIRH